MLEKRLGEGTQESPGAVQPRKIVIPEVAFPGLMREVSFNSPGHSLATVLRKWSAACKVNVAAYPGLLGATPTTRFPIWLKVKKASAKAALEWICRLCNCWYTVEQNGIWLVPDYRWVAKEPATSSVHLVGGLFEPPGKRLEQFLKQAFRIYLQNHPSASIVLFPDSGRLLAVLPRAGQEELDCIARELREHAGPVARKEQWASTVVLPQLREPRSRLHMREVSQRLQRTMRGIYQGTDIHEILAAIIDRTGINMAFDYRKVPPSRRRISMALGYVPARVVLDSLIKKSYLGRLAWEPGRGFWIYAEGDVMDEPVTRQQPWQRVIFRSYPALDIVMTLAKRTRQKDERRAIAIAADRLIDELRQKIGGNWQEPSYAIGYNVATGRVLLQHEVAVHLRIPTILKGLRALEKVGRDAHRLMPPGRQRSSN